MLIQRIKYYLNMVVAQAHAKEVVERRVDGLSVPILEHACKILLFGEKSTSWRGEIFDFSEQLTDLRYKHNKKPPEFKLLYEYLYEGPVVEVPNFLTRQQRRLARKLTRFPPLHPDPERPELYRQLKEAQTFLARTIATGNIEDADIETYATILRGTS